MDVSSLRRFAFLPYDSCRPDSITSERYATQHDQDTIKVKQTSSWSYSGPLLTVEPAALPMTIHEWLKATFEGCLLGRLLPLLSFVNSFLLANDIQHYWLTIRATQANHDYDLSRWHIDNYNSVPVAALKMENKKQKGSDERKGGALLSRHRSKQSQLSAKGNISAYAFPDWKICTTLLGPHTLFIASDSQAKALAVQKQVEAELTTDHDCCSIRCLGCASSAEKIRSALAEKLDSYEQVQAEGNVCTFFRIGDAQGAVHSEPPMSADDRVFINVIPGTADGLEKLMARWGMNFPRDWWTGGRMVYPGDHHI